MGLRFKLFIPTLVLLVTVSSLIHFYWLPYYIASEAEHQFEYERAYAKLLGNTLTPYLLSNNIKNINSILDEALEHNDYWHAVKLYKDQQRLYPLLDETLPEGMTLEPLQCPILVNNKNIANMTVWIDTKSSNAKTIKHVYYLEQLVLSLLLGISLLAIIFQERFIRKPINTLAALTRDISAGRYDTDLSYESKDELGILADSFNVMRKQIGTREEKLKYYSRIQDTIRHIQDTFILNINDEHVFHDLLKQVLEITESEHGFIGEVLYDKNGSPYIKTFCASSMFINKNNGGNGQVASGEGLEFHNHDSLPGKVLATSKPFISNAISTDAPDLKAMNMKNFFGLPLTGGNRLIGVLGVANRNGGYSASLYDDLQALLVTLSGLITAYHDEKELHESETRFRSVVDKAADGMITINTRGIMQGCNAAVVKMFGHSLNEMLGKNVSMLMPEPYHSQHDQYLGNYLTTGVKNIIGISREVKGLHKDGTVFPLELAVSEVELSGERMFIGITHDITQRVQAEQIRLRYSKTLEKFHKITSRSDLIFEKKIDELLKLGQETFNLPLAILSRIEDDRYIIEYVNGPEESPKPNTLFRLGETYCYHTLATNMPTGFNHVGESDIKNHPCYKTFGYEAYIGDPIYVGDSLHGTLSFAGPDAHEEAFTSIDYSLIQLFTQWIGNEMDRVNAEAQLELAYIEVNQANEELEKLSRTDGLTGLANRRHFDEVLSQELNRAIRYHSELTLILCDIDFFKNYNDTYGHQAGDVCLQKVTRAIHSSFLRAGELVARYGGEEFAVIIPKASAEKSLKLAEDMRNNVINLNLNHEASTVAQYVTISIGVATLIPHQNTTMSVLIELADNALYEAKENGRNNVQQFR